jgi:hypothetical protein
MALKYWGSNGSFLSFALALPLAALVVPVGSADWGKAEAAAVKQAKKRKVVVARKPAGIGRVCTVSKVKRRKVKRCRIVPVVVPPPIVTIVQPQPATLALVNPVTPAIGHPIRVVPVMDPPPPLPVSPPYAVNPPDYYWIDQADSLAQAFGNSPPDFTFSCDGVDCWAWVSRDGEVLIVEPGRAGVQQYFFAARQTSPYLVRDSYNAFAFDARDLIVVYDSQGRVMPYGADPRQRDLAAALRERGRALYAASLRQRRWDRGSATAWIGGTSSWGYDDGWNYGWNPFWRELPGWDRGDRDRHHSRPPRHLDDEHRDRDDARRRYDDWHRRGAPGAPPPTGNPVVTPTEGGTAAPAPRPPRPPRPEPAPVPAPAPAPVPQPGWQPQPTTDAPLPPPPPPAPPQAGDPPPRRERPRLEIEPEPGAPPILLRPVRPRPLPVEVPVTKVEAQPDPVPVPVPAPPPAPPPLQVQPAMPAPIQQYQAPPPPAPIAVPVPMPVAVPVPVHVPPPPLPPPPPPPPPREVIRADVPSDGADFP